MTVYRTSKIKNKNNSKSFFSSPLVSCIKDYRLIMFPQMKIFSLSALMMALLPTYGVAACRPLAPSANGVVTGINHILSATDGSDCTFKDRRYEANNVGAVTGEGTIARFTHSDVEMVSLGSNVYTFSVGAQNGGGNSNRPGGTAIFEGNLTVEGGIGNSRNIYMGNNGTMHVKGDLTATRFSGGAANIQLANTTNKLTVDGNVNINSYFSGASIQGIRNSGIINFNKNLEIQTIETNIIQSDGEFNMPTKNSNIKLVSWTSHAFSISGGVVNIAGNIYSQTLGSGSNFAISGGTTNISGNVKASIGSINSSFDENSRGNIFKVSGGDTRLHGELNATVKGNSDIVAMSGGLLELGKSTLSTDGSGRGIDLNGGSLTFNGDTQISIKNGYGIHLREGVLINKGELSITQSDNDIHLLGDASSGNTVTFINQGTYKALGSSNAIDNSGGGVLSLKNRGVLSSNQAVLLNKGPGTIEADNSDTMTGYIYNSDGKGGGIINLNNSGLWQNTSDSMLSNLTNSGIIEFAPLVGTRNFRTIEVTGDYIGNNGLIKMRTIWNAPGGTNGENSNSDLLIIGGTAKGNTTVMAVNADGTENVIDGNVKQVSAVLNTIPVVTVGTSGDMAAFTGTAQTTGATEVQLAKRTNAQGGDEYYWTTKIEPPVIPEPTPEPTPIYSESTPAYVQAPKVNMELGFATVGTLHERVGEQQTLAWDNCGECQPDVKGQVWGRIHAKHLDMEGKKRLGFETDIYLVQFGTDIAVNYNPETGSRRHTGVMVSYGQSDTDFTDQKRAENGRVAADKYTGKMDTHIVTLGGYSTYYDKNGSYLDLVGQVFYVRNKYEARNGYDAKQNGWGGALSAEVGRPYQIGESNWLIEPQAQLTYQYLSLNDFNDGTRQVKSDDHHGLRGRLGARLAYNVGNDRLKTNTFYVTANVLHDFVKPSKVRIGRDRISEDYSRTWAEVGFGAQTALSKSMYLYADARYEHSLTGEKRKSYRGTVGFKYTWK